MIFGLGVFASVIVSHLLTVMGRLLRAVLFLFPFAIASATPNRQAPHKRQTFSLQSNRKEPLWRNATSRLGRRDAPDAVSMHVDPNHISAWSPIQLGGS